MFNKIFRVIDFDYSKDSKQFHVHLEGSTVEEVKELFDYVWKKLGEYEK